MSRLLGLRGRLTAALLAISALTLAIAAIALLVPLDRQLRDDALRSLAQTAQTARPTFADLPAAAVRRGSPQLDGAVRELQRRTATEVAVVDAQGRTLAATNLDASERFPDAARALRERRPVSAIVDNGGEGEAQAAIPLEAHGHRLGLALRKSLDDLSSAQRVVRRSLAVAGLIALAVALLAGIVLAGRLVRRLAALRDTSLRVAEVGPDAEVQADDSRDEVGDLTRAFATMQRRLREQEQARRTFVATASHELRTPLTSLRLMLHSASDELGGPRPDLDDARDQLDHALGQTERLGKLAAELLDLSRLDSGLALRSELVELVEVTRAVLAEFGPRAERDDRTLALAGPDARWALADPGSVAQILRILLDNALRHSPPGTEVAIQVGATGERATLAVSDSGPGVAAHDAQRIFERFERGTEGGGDGGFGLGLAIGRQLARRMHGDLSLSGEGPGARFVLVLPAGAPPER